MRITKQYLSLLVVAIIFVSCSGGKSSEKVLLRLKPEIGKLYNLVVKMEVDGGANSLKNSMDLRATMKVKDVDDKGNVTLDVTYRKLSVEMKIKDQKMYFDSEQPDDEQANYLSTVFLPVKSMINKPSPMVLDNRSMVVKPLDFTSLIPDSIQRPGNEKQFNEAFDQMFTILPEKEVSEGDTWKDIINSKGEMPMKLDVTYTVEKISEDEVIIYMKATSKGTVSPVGETIDVKGGMTGKIYIDKKTGWTKKVDIKQDYVVKIMGNDMKMVSTVTMSSK